MVLGESVEQFWRVADRSLTTTMYVAEGHFSGYHRWGQPEDQQSSRKAGYDLLKPVKPETLQQLLTSILNLES